MSFAWGRIVHSIKTLSGQKGTNKKILTTLLFLKLSGIWRATQALQQLTKLATYKCVLLRR